MSKKDEALKLALEALEESGILWKTKRAITALREALAEQPAQRTWVGLTHDEIKAAYLAVSEIEWAICGMDDAVPFTRIIEAKLREKNNG